MIGHPSDRPVLRFTDVSITYAGQATPTLHDVDLDVGEAEVALVVGTTGSGKSTLLRAAIGLVPHFSGGRLAGQVLVAGRDTARHRPRELADVAGFVGQRPRASFVTEIVEDELAYGMENLGLSPDVMRRRVEEVLDLLAIADLRARRLDTLSAGQQQRVAIGGVLTTQPHLLLLDEPTSALDPAGAEEVLATLHRLSHDVGTTIVLAEHRLERVVHLADRIVATGADGTVRSGGPAELMRDAPVAPPVVRLGRALGWEPLPLSIRAARRAAAALRADLAGADLGAASPTTSPGGPRPDTPGAPAARIRGVRVERGQVVALDRIDLEIEAGTVTALMGRNGSGKSTLLGCLAGALRPTTGTVRVSGTDPVALDGPDRIRAVGLVPDEASFLLYGGSVAEELALADLEGGLRPGTTAGMAERIGLRADPHRHPLDLSDGQRLLLAVAVVAGHRPRLLLLDEPTRGVDYAAKSTLGAALRDLAADGAAVVLATHDVELVAEVADRVVVLGDGQLVTDGPARSVVCQSATLSPQVARIMAPLELLTVDEVVAAREAG